MRNDQDDRTLEVGRIYMYGNKFKNPNGMREFKTENKIYIIYICIVELMRWKA